MVTETFSAAGSEQTWTVPSGVTQVTIECWGAQGGSKTGTGGSGGYAEGQFSVTGGDTLYVYVGEQPGGRSGGWPNGGQGGRDDSEFDVSAMGGGGESSVRTASAHDTALIAAGGGGGATSDGDGNNDGGAGGAATISGADGDGGNGGEGHGASGSTPGAGGTGSGSSGEDGQSGDTPANGGNGGAGGNAGSDFSGGGGGGGWAGGGGGAGSTAASAYNGGGGGGSGYIAGSGSLLSESGGANTGDGQVVISYPDPPATPNNVSFTVEGDNQLSVTWDEDTTGGQPDSYDVQVSEDSGSWTQLTNTSSTSYTYSAPTSVNQFRFRVRAINVSGTTDWVYTATKATDPTNLSPISHNGSSVTLSWDETDGQTSYSVQRSESSGGPYTEVATPAAPPYTDSGLGNGERYYYVVQAVYTGTDSQLSNEAAQTTDLPAPTLDSLDDSVEDEITVSWTVNDDSADGSVEIYRSTDGSLGSLVHTETALATTTYTDTGLADGEQYHYTVRRVTDHTSSDSPQASAVTVLPAPTDLTVGTVTADTAALSWTANHDNGQTEVQLKPTSDVSWTTFSTVARTAESETLTGLRNGEAYDARVVATTEHTTTEDN